MRRANSTIGGAIICLASAFSQVGVADGKEYMNRPAAHAVITTALLRYGVGLTATAALLCGLRWIAV